MKGAGASRKYSWSTMFGHCSCKKSLLHWSDSKHIDLQAPSSRFSISMSSVEIRPLNIHFFWSIMDFFRLTFLRWSVADLLPSLFCSLRRWYPVLSGSFDYLQKVFLSLFSRLYCIKHRIPNQKRSTTLSYKIINIVEMNHTNSATEFRKYSIENRFVYTSA